MSIKSPSKTKYFLKIILVLVLLFQWTMPAMSKKKNTPINFSDVSFEKCNDPDHSHPPLSQRDKQDNSEKLVNSDTNNPFIISDVQNYFDIIPETIFKKPERSPKLLLKFFAPARSPPFFEV